MDASSTVEEVEGQEGEGEGGEAVTPRTEARTRAEAACVAIQALARGGLTRDAVERLSFGLLRAPRFVLKRKPIRKSSKKGVAAGFRLSKHETMRMRRFERKLNNKLDNTLKVFVKIFYYHKPVEDEDEDEGTDDDSDLEEGAAKAYSYRAKHPWLNDGLTCSTPTLLLSVGPRTRIVAIRRIIRKEYTSLGFGHILDSLEPLRLQYGGRIVHDNDALIDTPAFASEVAKWDAPFCGCFWVLGVKELVDETHLD